MKKLLLTLVCLSGMLSMSAVTVYMDRIGAAIIESGENGYSSDGFTFTALKNNGSTAPAYNATGKDLRIYAKGSFTIASETPITQLYFAISTQGKNRMAPITASTGTIEAQTVAPDFLVWKGDAKEVTFTVGDKAVYGIDGEAKAGQFDFLDIVINEEVTEEPTPDPDPDPDPVVTDAVENINAWLNAADSSKEIAISSPATAVFQSGRNLYIKDETGWLLVYGDVNQTYTNGMTIPAGYAGTFKDYNGLPEMVANAGTFQAGTAGTPVAPMQTSIPRATTLPLNSYIKIENVTLSAPNGKNQTASDDSDNELNLYNSLNINLPAAGSGYTIIGFLAIYNGTYQLTPVEITSASDPVDPDPVVTDAVDNIAAWLKAADTSKDIAISTPATAVHQNGRSLYIKDDTGWLLVYGDVNQTYTNGMTIPAGYAGTFKDYNGLPEMVANAGTFKAGTAGTPVAPIKTTVKDASSQPLNSYLQIENVTLSTADGKNQTATDASGNELKLYNSLYIDLPAAGSGYTVTGFLAIYNGTYQLTPVEITNGTGGGGGDQPVADENVTWFVAPGFTGYPADANVVVLHNQSGNDSPTTDEVTENAIDPSYGLFDKSFGNEKVAINFNIHGTNDFYPVAVGQQVRWYKNEGLTITAGEDLYVTEIYVATAAYSKGKFNLTQNGNEIGTVSGTGLDAANPITWTGAFKGSAEAVSEAQIRFNYITVRTADAASVNVVNTEVLSQPVRYYNLQGQEVKNPTNGLYIRVQGDRSSKVLIK